MIDRARNRRTRWHWLAMAVVGALLYLLLRHVDWAAVGAGFGAVDARFLPLLVLLLALNFVIRSWRWRHLLADGATISGRALIEATTVGFMATFLLPFRAGEVARPWILTRWEPVRFGAAAASIVVERVVDALVVIGFLAVAAAWIDDAPEWLGAGARLLGGVATLGLGMMILAYFFSDTFSRLARWVIARIFFARFLAKLRAALEGMTDEFLKGLRAISSGRQLAVVLVASLALWLEMALFYQVGLWTMGIDLGPLAGIMVMVLVALAVAAPGPPGFLGTFQIGCLAALGLFGVSPEVGLSYAVVTHVLQAVCIISAGLWILHARGLDLRRTLPPAATGIISHE